MTLLDVELEIEELKIARFQRVKYRVAGCIEDAEAIERLTDEIDELEQLANEMREEETDEEE
jgi:hypothetical protein